MKIKKKKKETKKKRKKKKPKRNRFCLVHCYASVPICFLILFLCYSEKYFGIMNFCLSQYYCFLQVDDLHRHKIDHFTIPSSRGPEFGVLRRVDDVRFLNQGCSAECLDFHYWALLFFPYGIPF
jgi:hypothetical protein